MLLGRLPAATWSVLEEIRLRATRPLILGSAAGETMLTAEGSTTSDPGSAYRVNEEDVARTVELVTGSSLYAVEDELRQGFVTVSGGHRVGLCGRAVVEGGRVRTLKYLSGVNFRVSREVHGAADQVLPWLLRGTRGIYNTLIISPPRCGKTTLLRDFVRQISDGVPHLGCTGLAVGVVDERSEIAGCYRGIPQRDVGIRTDVLDGCPKAEGMMMLLRALSPEVIATDEIGRREDVEALEEMLNAGVNIVATAHAASVEELRGRPVLRELLGRQIVERFIILEYRHGPGVVRAVVDGRTFQAVGGTPRCSK
ncbi:MAG: stage III sporulation protein AA [Candidatus Desulforudis sp.]|nr:stage III sporulation protein AA [Desulforudis sp.]